MPVSRMPILTPAPALSIPPTWFQAAGAFTSSTARFMCLRMGRIRWTRTTPGSSFSSERRMVLGDAVLPERLAKLLLRGFNLVPVLLGGEPPAAVGRNHLPGKRRIFQHESVAVQSALGEHGVPGQED